MRALVAASLAVFLVLASAGPHVHVASHGPEDCVVCAVRVAGAASRDTPDVAPFVLPVGEVSTAPGLPPVCGAPLGAIPGQSPPVNA